MPLDESLPNFDAVATLLVSSALTFFPSGLMDSLVHSSSHAPPGRSSTLRRSFRHVRGFVIFFSTSSVPRGACAYLLPEVPLFPKILCWKPYPKLSSFTPALHEDHQAKGSSSCLRTPTQGSFQSHGVCTALGCFWLHSDCEPIGNMTLTKD